MDEALFSNIAGNAVDGDFCTGSISNSSFVNIGGNGISLRGAEVNLSHLFFNSIDGAGISAGEESELDARWIDLRNAAAGIASQDGSAVALADVLATNCQVGIAAFQEKKSFGPGLVAAQRIEFVEVASPFLVEMQSGITLDGNPVAENADKVKDILFGQENKGKAEQTEDL